MFADLLATPGVSEHCELRSARIGFMAIHGGLEAGTFEIAQAAAEASGASLYAVVQPADVQWHVPSHRFSRSESASLTAFFDHVDMAISLHGYGGVRDSPNRWTTVVLGGSNRLAASQLGLMLSAALPEYTFIDDIDAIPSQYRGLHCDNPVNQTRRGGVQVELPPRIRGNSPVWDGAPRSDRGMVIHSESLIDTFVAFTNALER